MGHFFMRMAFYFTARAFHHMDGIGGAGIEQDHTEFIAAQSAQNISMPDRSLHIFRKGDKSPVPRAMSQLVVKRLEIEIGRAHVRTPVTNAHIVCRLLLEKKKTNYQINTQK